MEFYIRNGGSWRKADPAKGIYVYNNGWKEAQEVWIRNGGSWRKGYQKSDPITYYFEPSGSNSYRLSGWRGSNDVRVGSFADSNRPAGYGDHAAVFDFTSAVDPTAYISYADAIADRPVCSDAKITFKRKTGTGFSTTGNGNTWYTGHTGNFGSGTVGLSTTYQRATTGSAPNGPDGWSGNGQSIFLVNTDLAADLLNNYLYVSNTQTLSSTGGYDDDYSALDGHLDGTPPVLQLTLDYA